MHSPRHFEIRPSNLEDFAAISELLAAAPPGSVHQVGADEFRGWLDGRGVSLVAVDTETKKPVGHIAAVHWESVPCFEVRAAVVAQTHWRRGINRSMYEQILRHAWTRIVDIPVITFTEPASMIRGNAERLGGREISFSEVPDDLYTVCPAFCHRRTGAPCGCKVYLHSST